MALISTQAAGSVKGFGFTRPYVAPPAPVADSKNAILNLSLNHDYDGNHNNAAYSSIGNDLWGNFKDETGNNYPQPKHDHVIYKNTFHSHLSPYHPAGWSCEFNSTYSLANYSTNGNDPGTGACTWETWVLLHPHQANQISGAGSSNRNMVISGRDTNTSSSSESDGAWTFGIAGNQTATATGVYLIYRNGGTTYKKYWYQGNPANSGLPIPRGQWHHIAIVRHQGTDGSNVYKCYLNGTQLINTQYDTFPDNMHISSSGTRAVFFGGYRTVETGGNILDGKIKDYALTHSAKYTSNFTPPIRPMSQALDSSVNLMFPYGPTYAIGSAQSDVVNTNTSQIGWLMRQVNTSGNWQTASYIERTSMVRSSPYDYVVDYAKNNLLGSVYMNPQNDYRSGISQGPITSGNIGSDPGISLGTNDFTVEFWYYMNGNNGGSSSQERQTFIDFRAQNGHASNNGPYMYYWKPQDANGGLKIEYPGISMTSHQVMQQQWVHVAIVRSGDLGYLYINGNQSGGSASLAGRNFSGPDGRPMWGCTGNNYTSSSSTVRDQFNGYMTDCRITVGTAVYTGNFKPPIGKLTLTGGDYPNITNVNVSIPTGHVKQLLSFTNNPFHDTVGKEQYMHPFFSSTTTYPAVDIIKDKEEAEAADFSAGKQEGIIYASNLGNYDKFGLDIAVDSDGTTLVASAPYEDTGGTDRGMAYILKKGASTTLQGAAYDNVYSPQVTNANFGVDMSKPTSILFNADGTKLYLGDMTAATIYQWSLSSPYSITSGSFTYDNKSYYVGGTGLTQNLLSIKWNNDGTKLYTLSNANDKIFEHDLSTAYDISTASYSNVNFSHSQEYNSKGFGFSHDGTKMFVGGATDRLHMYNLSTAWDLSTASYSNGYMSHGVTSQPADVYFDEGGTRMFLLSYGNNIRQYNLPVPFNPTTGNITTPYMIQINGQESQAYSYAFNGDFSKFYVVGPNTDKIYQYSTGGATAVYTEEVSLANPISTNNSFFGWNVGVNDAGTRVVVGMPGPYVNNAGTEGYTYVYDKSGSSWPTSPTATIQSSDFTSGDFFGKGCNISGDGNYIVVGAERENGYPGNYSYNGSAYVFTQFTTGFNLPSSSFTQSSPAFTTQESNPRGFLFNGNGTKLYIIGTSTYVWKIYSLSTAYDITTASYDGSSYDISNTGGLQHPDEVKWSSDGTKVYMLDTTDKYIYESNVSTAYDISTASHWSWGSFGSGPVGFDMNPTATRVAILENDNRVKDYNTSSGLNNNSQVTGYTGTNGTLLTEVSVATSFCWNNDGKKFFVSCSTNDRIYQYSVRDDAPYEIRNVTYDNVSIDISGKETTPTMISFENAGSGYAGGKLFVLGGTDKLHEYSVSGFNWAQQAKLSEAYTTNHNDNLGRYFGQAIAVDTDGDTIAIGAPGMTDLTTTNYNATYGHAEVWVRNGTTWTAQAEIKPADDDRLAEDGFGANLALSGDGNTLVVGQKSYQGSAGSNAIGNAWVFTRSGTTWTLLQKLTAGLSSGDWFGFDVAITKDAEYIAVSAPKEAAGSSNQNAGKVFTFRKVGSAYALQGSIEAEDVTADDLFGYSLAITNDKGRVITGAPHEDKTSGSSINFGAVYTHTPGSIANWPATEPSQLGGATTTGKSYMYFTGGGNTSNMMSKLIYPYGYDQVNSGAKKSAVFEGMAFTDQMIDGYAFTVEAWIYPMQPASDNNNTEHHLWSYGDPNQNLGNISLKLKQASSSDTTFQWVFETKRDTDNNMASNNNYNQWYHVALVALGGYEQPSTGGRGAEYRFFVNGVRDTTISTININNYNWLEEGGAFIIGGQHVYSDYRMFDQPTTSMSSYGNGHRNFTGIVRNFRVERTNKYWSSNFTPTDLTSI